MLRLLHRLALAVLTVLVCAGIASPTANRTDIVVAAIDVATAGDAERAQPSHDWRRGAAHPDADLEAFESDSDDDDDATHHAGEGAWVAVDRITVQRGGASPRYRRACAIDPSRFAVSTRLPRGPPV